MTNARVLEMYYYNEFLTVGQRFTETIYNVDPGYSNLVLRYIWMVEIAKNLQSAVVMITLIAYHIETRRSV